MEEAAGRIQGQARMVLQELHQKMDRQDRQERQDLKADDSSGWLACASQHGPLPDSAAEPDAAQTQSRAGILPPRVRSRKGATAPRRFVIASLRAAACQGSTTLPSGLRCAFSSSAKRLSSLSESGFIRHATSLATEPGSERIAPISSEGISSVR